MILQKRNKMFKFYSFKLGKRKNYKGWGFKIGWLKFERIGFKSNFMWRIELTNWEE